MYIVFDLKEFINKQYFREKYSNKELSESIGRVWSDSIIVHELHFAFDIRLTDAQFWLLACKHDRNTLEL